MGAGASVPEGTPTKEEFLASAKGLAEANPGNRCIKYLLEVAEKDLFTEEQWYGLYKCAKTGVENPDSGLGCYAMAPTDYEVYAEFFDRVCNDYHNNPAGDKKHVTSWEVAEGIDLDMSKLGLTDPLSMRVRVGRNLKSFPLPGMMTESDRITFEKTMLSAFAKLVEMEEYGGSVYSLTPNENWGKVFEGETNPNLISAEKYDELVKAHVMFKDMAADPFLASAGIASDWPCGRGCYQSKDGGFIIWFGEEDQLRIMCMGKGFNLLDVFGRLEKALKIVEGIEGIEFATSDKYGYVTSCPSNLGTGMRASVHVKIPNLVADGDEHGFSANAVAVAKPLGLSVRGTGGEHTPIGADGTCDISPSNRLFITEGEIVSKLYEGIKNLLAAEAAAATPAAAEAAPAAEAAAPAAEEAAAPAAEEAAAAPAEATA